MSFLKLLSRGATFDRKRFGREMAMFSDAEKLRQNKRRRKGVLEDDAEGQSLQKTSKKRREKVKVEEKPETESDAAVSDEESSESESGEEQSEVRLFSSGETLRDVADVSKQRRKKKQKHRLETAVVREFDASQALRRRHAIHVDDKRAAPKPMQSFDEMLEMLKDACDEERQAWRTIVRNLREMGVETPSAVQMQAVPSAVVAQDEVLVCAPTGSGKTLAFLLPIMLRLRKPCDDGIRAIVVAPTAELAAQIDVQLQRLLRDVPRQFRLRHLLLQAGNADRNTLMTAKRDLLVTTPLRLARLLRPDLHGKQSKSKKNDNEPVDAAAQIATEGPQLPSLTAEKDKMTYKQRKQLRIAQRKQKKLEKLSQAPLVLPSVEMVVLDEADQLLDLGMLQQVDTIFAACTSKQVQRMLFSATLYNSVEDLAKTLLRQPARIVVGDARGQACANVQQHLHYCGREAQKTSELIGMLRESGKFKPPAIVFVQQKRRARRLFRELQPTGLRVDFISGERTPEEREEALLKFREGETWLLVATSLMARGMDFKHVNQVFNLDMPPSTADYVHRVGRAGRAGREGEAITFFTDADRQAGVVRPVVNLMRRCGQGAHVPAWMQHADQVQLPGLSKRQKKQLKRTGKVARKKRTKGGASKK